MDKSSVDEGEVALPPGEFLWDHFVLCPAREIQNVLDSEATPLRDAFLSTARPAKEPNRVRKIGLFSLYLFWGALSTRFPYFAGVLGRWMSTINR